MTHDLPPVLEKETKFWLYTNRKGINTCDIMFVLTDQGTTYTSCISLRDHLCQSATPITRRPWYNNWFVLRLPRITATVGAHIFMQNAEIWKRLNSPAYNAPLRMSVDCLPHFSKLCFGNGCSTEAVNRGTENSISVMEAISRLPFVREVYDIGMWANRDNLHI